MKELNRYESLGVYGGEVKQSGTPAWLPGRGGAGLRAHGLLLSGVVVTTYVQTDDASPFPAGVMDDPVAVYCDVITYSSAEGLYSAFLRGVLVLGHGMHHGHVWRPRAASQDVRTGTLNADTMDPRDLDGDHVLISFLEDNLSKPIIVGLLPHPRTGLGNAALPAAGHRMRLKVADGNPELWKHQGTFHGVDNDGNYLLDTTRAHSGKYDVSGNEVPVPDDAHGNVIVKVNRRAKFRVVGLDKDGGAEAFRLELEDGKATVQMGGSLDNAVVLDTDAGKLAVTLGGPGKSLTLDEAAGKLVVKLGSDAASLTQDATSLDVKLGGDGLKVENAGPAAVLTVGNGADNGVVFNALKTYIDAKLDVVEQHTHSVDLSSTVGNLGYPVSGSATASASTALVGLKGDGSVYKSAHIKIPVGFL